MLRRKPTSLCFPGSRTVRRGYNTTTPIDAGYTYDNLGRLPVLLMREQVWLSLVIRIGITRIILSGKSLPPVSVTPIMNTVMMILTGLPV